MADLHNLVDGCIKSGLDFFTGVPDSLLNDFCNYLNSNLSLANHVMAANEGNAIAIAAGHYLATGNVPVVYMQNSGIGNAMNPVLSLAHGTVYAIPMILVIGWRGDPSVTDHAQHRRQGELTPVLLEDMDIPFRVLANEETLVDDFKWAAEQARRISSPVALVAKKGILSRRDKKQDYPESELMSREEAISVVLDACGPEAVYLATTGRATRELHSQLQTRGWQNGGEFLNVGSMGHVSSVGLGVALAAPTRRVVVLDGDAAAVMHMGSLATIGRYHPANLVHVVLNNGVNESVGGQASAGMKVSLYGIASACGYSAHMGRVTCAAELKTLLTASGDGVKPLFVDVAIRQGIRTDLAKLNIDHKTMISKLMDDLRRRCE